MKTMADIITAHLDLTGDEYDLRYIAAVRRLATDVEKELTAAGFGLVADAVVIHVAHDTEAHARSFNEGYETAIAQGLADDPSLAQDWLDAKLADAKREALEEAAEELDLPGSDATGYYASEQDSGYREAERHTESWLRARAAAVRGEG